MADNIILRSAVPSDVESLYLHQADADGAAIAMVYPRTLDAFTAHFSAVCNNPDVFMRVIMFDGAIAGSIGSFVTPTGRAVGYSIASEHRRRGIGTRALALFLAEFSPRPLRATVARANIASRRILERNGFTLTGYSHEPATERYIACEVAHYITM